VETGGDLHPQIDPEADVRATVLADHAPMTTTDYLIDSALVLIAALALTGLSIGVASALAVRMRRDADGDVLARAGWASAFFWVLGMGSRFAFLIWISHGGSSSIASFSATHSITSGAAWTDALLGMAVLEVLGRSLAMALRRRQLQAVGTPELA
jgi:hypothetical protein